MLGRHSSSTTHPDETVADEPDGRIMSSPGARRARVGENADATRPMARTNDVGADRSAPAARWGAADQTDADNTDPLPPGTVGSAGDTVGSAGDTVTEPATEHGAVVASKRWAHVSGMATLSLIAGTLAVAATLTGLLAPIGFAVGVLAVLFGILALFGVQRAGVTGHGLVGLGLLFGVVAIVVSVLAMSHSVSWISNRTDEIAVLHNWLNSHVHWLRRW